MIRARTLIVIIGVVIFCISITFDLIAAAVTGEPVVLMDSIRAAFYSSFGAWAMTQQDIKKDIDEPNP